MDSLTVGNRGQICLAFPPLTQGEFIRRENRFRVRVMVDDAQVPAYLANPGRLEELLIPGRTMWLTPAGGAHRKTSYNSTLIEHPDGLVSLNSHLPNRLIAEALREGAIPGFQPFPYVRSEVPLGESRLDFMLQSETNESWWIEVKSVTLMTEGIAQFPDAPTARGRRHLRELIKVVKEGGRASVLFVIQRADAVAFAPHDTTDPDFGDLLRAAAAAGVGVRAFRCTVALTQICLDDEIPVSLDAQLR